MLYLRLKYDAQRVYLSSGKVGERLRCRAIASPESSISSNRRGEDHMEKIYIAFVDTPGLFASALHGYLKQKYIHVVLSLDENLDEAYSFGRRNPAVPLVAGYEGGQGADSALLPDADYMIGAIDCTAEQKEQIRTKSALVCAPVAVSLCGDGASVYRHGTCRTPEPAFYLFLLRGKVPVGCRDRVVCEG